MASFSRVLIYSLKMKRKKEGGNQGEERNRKENNFHTPFAGGWKKRKLKKINTVHLVKATALFSIIHTHGDVSLSGSLHSEPKFLQI